jgi:cyclopropane fatty-acyl-phospholipid synthase-like methyltransferase
MAEINLLARYPKSKRNVRKRETAKTDEIVAISRQYGEAYFDGDRAYGYGGYGYDGRWLAIAEDMVAHFDLKAGDRVLDVGCAKGFLVKDMMTVCPGLEAFGVDVSEYALMHCEPETVGRLHLGSADSLPFPDGSFQAVISVNTVHNLPRERCIKAVTEIERLAPGKGYIQVDSYRTDAERLLFLDWVLTAHSHFDPEGWKRLFTEAGFTGDYYWTIVD